ncbi:ribbon-helix-helix protein, CopG family [Halomonas nitroreducens]|uniref:Ribbon-helix-helix protein, CopG family n=1 Tax=Halomonas nitroreducens TaxID=447425 RepID=A0A431V666_9GAMM|nr:ribbon-helix-helix protein, CopG family [Halomonas nitroreducens]RTR04952.1 ribbon-helix-helix protein, CopG family [Halomonas nitroreducens]
MPMPHLLRLTRDQEIRLDRLAERCGLSRTELLERLVAEGLAALETELMVEGAGLRRAERSIDQLLRESGLGA